MEIVIKNKATLNFFVIVVMFFAFPSISWPQKENANSGVEYNQKQIESLSSKLVKSQTFREIQVAVKRMSQEVKNARTRLGNPRLKISQSKISELNLSNNMTIKQRREELAKMGVVVSDEYIKLSTEKVPKLYDKLYSEFPELKTLSNDTKKAALANSRTLYNKISFK